MLCHGSICSLTCNSLMGGGYPPIDPIGALSSTTAVTSSSPPTKIASTSSLTTETMATSSLTTETMATSSLTTETMATSSLTTETMATSSLTTETMATSSLTTETMATSSLTPETMATSSLTPETMATSSLTTETTANSSLTTETASVSLSPQSTGVPTTSEPDPCANQPCKSATACINLNQGYLCQCPYGFFYSSSSSGCYPGKVFPGEFILNVTYDQKLKNVKSKEYLKLYCDVTNIFNTTFHEEKSYKETIIKSVESSSEISKKLSKAEAKNYTKITFINMFDTNTNLTSETWLEVVNNYSFGYIGSKYSAENPDMILHQCY
ncbi:mucin-13-like isoform X2 [Rhineura floridana]|uniref:mucin-13-like isoform X2 n=1 Tax=Rhineura floridana TaxID=261503 RepID=UPI002AC86ABF|nr:mucin-13-like isoform X2 [Rhineura floridana]